MCNVCRRLHDRNLLAAADGNVSLRLADGRIAITPSGVNKATIRPEHIAFMSVSGSVLSGHPSSERLMHLAIYGACPDARAVVHAHPPTAIAWTIARPDWTELPGDILPEVVLGVGSIPIVPYARPGTDAVGAALLPSLPRSRALILARHGVVCWGETLAEGYDGIRAHRARGSHPQVGPRARRFHRAAGGGSGRTDAPPRVVGAETAVKPLESLGLRYDGRRVLVLDQTELPDREVWLNGGDPDAMVARLQALRVRGAPLIGVAAAVSLASMAEQGAGADAVRAAAARLRAARPTAVNLMLAVDRMLGALTRGGAIARDIATRGAAQGSATAESVPNLKAALAAEAERIFDEDVALCESMAAAGAPLIRDGDGVLTHCNTGGLATGGIGTALGVLRRASEGGVRLHVYVDETRPLLQGGRLTTWELGRLGVPYTLLTDSMAAILMRQGKVHG